jgi:choline dehydrogenase-like flavoprotein
VKRWPAQQPLAMPLADWLVSAQGQAAVAGPAGAGGVAPGPGEPLDVVIIGSGYGGSVAALRLAERGRRVLVLERGAEFLPGDFPNDVGQLPKFMRAQLPTGVAGNALGLFEARPGLGLSAVVANGLGGGSLVNAGVMMRPDADVFAQPAWPAALRHATPGAALTLEAAFDRAAAMLGGTPLDDDAFGARPKAQLQRRLAARLGTTAAAVTATLDPAHCTRCGDCASGCNVPGAKRTLRDGYLARAHRAGATLVTRALVHAVRPAGDGDGWWVDVLPTERSTQAATLADAAALHGRRLKARVVVIAAGSFGSTELLQRSQALAGGAFTLSPALGTRLSGNGDAVSVLADVPQPAHGVGHGARAGTTPAPEPVGPTITTVIDLRGRPGTSRSGDHGEPLPLEQRIVLQEGAVPGALAGVYRELIAATWTLHHLGRRWRSPRTAATASRAGADPLAASPALARHSQLLLAMGHDGSAGRIVWQAGSNAAFAWWPEPGTLACHRAQQALYDRLEATSGGVHLHTPLWRALPPAVAALADDPKPQPQLLTVHPLGGCPMADHVDHGVADHAGRVWRSAHAVWPGLYVLDGSVVPTALGCNPLWTITALAERAVACWDELDAQAAPGDVASNAAPPADAPPPSPTAPPAPLPPRAPQPLQRAGEPAYDVDITERLAHRALPLGRALARALRQGSAECDLRLVMRAHDFAAVWQAHGRHVLRDVQGRLRLVGDAAHAGAPAPRLEYHVEGGEVELFSPARRWPVLGTLQRLGALVRVGLTWWLLRGNAERGSLVFTRQNIAAMVWLGWAATDERRARYRLQLRLSHAEGLAHAPPTHLHVTGAKHVAYAAGWGPLLRHAVTRLWQGAWHRAAHARRRRAELRPSVFVQLTSPTLEIAEPGWAWPGRRTRATFEFDIQEALRQPPARLLGSGDTGSGLLALASYPALLARLVLHTRAFDLALPGYSRVPLPDSAADVALRCPGAPPPEETVLEVPRGASASDTGFDATGPARLRLWRYRRPPRADDSPGLPEVQAGTWCGLPVRRARSVLLMHAFDMSGHAFTFKTTHRNLAEHLWATGHEVWVLDSRMSPRTEAAEEPCTVDQIGLLDAPCTVDHILATLGAELDAQARATGGAPADAPLQIFAVGQCMGAAALLIGLLAGRLSHDAHVASAAHASAAGFVPRMPKLAALVTSQVHPWLVGSRSAQARTWLPALLRNLAPRTRVPLAVRGPVTNLVEATADRLFATLPVPPGEHCPESPRGQGDDDCATCRRVRFLLGGMFRHANVNLATHRELPRLFGAGSVRLFAQGAQFFDRERLVSEDGLNTYVTGQAVGERLALPLRFVHGAENDLFDCVSATRSAERYAELQPRWSHRFGVGGSGLVCDVIAGYGHLDVLIGREAMQPGPPGAPSVYGRLSALFDEVWWLGGDIDLDAGAHAGADAAHGPASAARPRPPTLQLPKAGPFVGPVEHAADGSRHVGIAFVLDDEGADDQAHAPRAAAALVDQGRGWRRVPMTLEATPLPLVVRHGHAAPPHAGPAGALQGGMLAAHGRIRLEPVVDGAGAAGPLRIRCFSHADPGGDPPDVDLLLAAWHDRVARLQDAERRAQAEVARPFPKTASSQRRQPRRLHHAETRIAPARTADADPRHPVRVALTCCRYPGLGLDRDRADAAWIRLLAASRRAGGPDLLLMMGDQVYADASAGIGDPISPVERFVHPHQAAFTRPALRALLRRLPALALADDHELIEGWPAGPEPFRAHAADPAHAEWRNAQALRVAQATVRAYQQMAAPASWRDEGWCAFGRGAVRFFAFDARLQRRFEGGALRIVGDAAWRGFDAWLAAVGQTPGALACVLTSSAVLPGVHPGSDPGDGGAIDTFQASPADRQRLLTALVRRAPGRFVLVTGDYHLAWAGALLHGGRPVGAAVVAPPLYAPMPYANTAPASLWLGETVAVDGAALTLDGSSPPRRGSGFGLLGFEPPAPGQAGGRGWRVALTTHAIDLDAAAPWARHDWPAIGLPA